jgi:hypothetical protein
MTTYGDLHCVDCNEAMELSSVRAYLAERIARMAPQFLALEGRAEQLDVSIERIAIDGALIYPAWFAQHAGHRIVAKDQYGNALSEERALAWTKHLDWNGIHLAFGAPDADEPNGSLEVFPSVGSKAVPVRVVVGPDQTVVIDKQMGPSVFWDVRVRADLDRYEWVLEQAADVWNDASTEKHKNEIVWIERGSCPAIPPEGECTCGDHRINHDGDDHTGACFDCDCEAFVQAHLESPENTIANLKEELRLTFLQRNEAIRKASTSSREFEMYKRRKANEEASNMLPMDARTRFELLVRLSEMLTELAKTAATPTEKVNLKQAAMMIDPPRPA